MVQIVHEPPRFVFDDRHRGGQFAVAIAAIPLANRFQVVDRIQIHAQAIADRRLEIARHRQIENQQRPLIAARASIR